MHRLHFRCTEFSLATVWAFLALPVVLLASIITPPFQVPDEHQHFFRAVQISEGVVLGVRIGDKAGGILPSANAELVDRWLGTREPHFASRKKIYETENLRRELNHGADPGAREFVEFSGAVRYFPFAYIPQAIGVALARALSLGSIYRLYGARIVNGLVAVVLIWYALRIGGRARDALFATSSFPMVLYLFGSASPDAMVIAFCFLYIALSLRIIETCSMDVYGSFQLILSSLVVVTLKPVYAPIFLIPLFVNFRSVQALRICLVMTVAPLLVSGGVLWAWMHYTAFLAPPSVGRGNALPTEGYLGWWKIFGERLARTVLYKYEDYFQQMIGVFGWLTHEMAKEAYLWVVLSAGLVLTTSTMSVEKLGAKFRLGLFFILAASSTLIFLALYVYWTKSTWIITGVQGRYFIPLLPIVLIVFENPLLNIYWPQMSKIVRGVGLFGMCTGIACTPLILGISFWRFGNS